MDRREFFRRAGCATLSVPVLEAGLSPHLSAAEQASEDVGIFLAGDVMIGRGIDQILPHSVEPTLYEGYVKNARTYVRIAREAGASIPDEADFGYVWGDALGELMILDPDVRIVNLETAVTTSPRAWPSKGIHYRMHPGNVPLLTVADLDAVVLGNNHVLDWGRDGLAETLESLGSAGLATVGAGVDADDAAAPAVIQTAAGRTLVFSYASPTSGVDPEWAAGADRSGVNLLAELGADGAERVAEQVRARREAGDLVIVSIHWGSNWGYEVPDEQRAFARRLVELDGADLIHGHSSHHPKAIEVHSSRLILYGAGDFLNDYEGIGGNRRYRGELTLMYFPRLAPDGALVGLTMTPMRIQDFRLHRADAAEIGWISEMLNREGAAFGTGTEPAEDGRLVLRWG